jgi:16S rRNA processing protein RimM
VTDLDQWMVIGQVAGPFGLRGEIKIDLRTDFPNRFAGLERIFLGPSRRPYTVAGARRHRRQVLLRLEGVENPESVDRLRGLELAIPRELAIPLPPGHFYLEEILGVEVVTVDGANLGNVTDVLRTGSNDVFVVGTGSSALLIPSIKDAIAELDLEGRRIVIHPWVIQPPQ